MVSLRDPDGTPPTTPEPPAPVATRLAVDAMAPGGARAVARCDALGVPPYSDREDGLFRAYLTPAYRAAQDRLTGWMADAGMHIRRDAAMNLVGRYEGHTAGLPALIFGSHLDSVADAGRYDGPLGIMLGIEVVTTLAAAGRRLPFAIEVYAFGDEEGSRFPAAMLTSRAVAGTLGPESLGVVDKDGVGLAQCGVDPGAYLSAARKPDAVVAYFEAHIEQGPVLEAEGLAIGAVTGIAGQIRLAVTVRGVAGHAGTTTMALRRDPLPAAAEMVLGVERVAREAASDVVATVGRIEALPGAANVIPGEVRFTVDVRSGDDARRDAAADAIRAALAEIGSARGLDTAIDEVHRLAASPCDPALTDLVVAACLTARQPAFRLVSGAGHDAMVMAALAPTAMLFVRCAGGVSHNPAEAVDPDDVAIALTVMLGFVERLVLARGGEPQDV